MFPSHRFQWLELANSGTKVEGERETLSGLTLFLLICLVALTGDFG